VPIARVEYLLTSPNRGNAPCNGPSQLSEGAQIGLVPHGRFGTFFFVKEKDVNNDGAGRHEKLPGPAGLVRSCRENCLSLD